MSEREELAQGLLGHLKSLRAAGVRYIPLGAAQGESPPAAPVQKVSPVAEKSLPEEKKPPAEKSSPAIFPQPEENQGMVPSGKKDIIETPALPFDPAEEMALPALEEAVAGCLRCKLGAGRENLVFGAGNPAADLVFVGEAPGASEDAEGIPFVGRAGQMLTKMIENVIEISRQDVYICNILKCRPPGNRNPEPDEIACCEPYLHKQLEIIQPKIICALGKFAAQWLLQTTLPIGKLRGKFGRYRGVPTLATYHPAYLLRSPSQKRVVMDDLLQIKAILSGEIEPEIEIHG